MTDTEQKI